MSSPINRDMDRLLELLADRVTEGLDEKDSAELERLAELHSDEALRLELASAAVDQALFPPTESLFPEHVGRQILLAAGDHLRAVRGEYGVGRVADEGGSEVSTLPYDPSRRGAARQPDGGRQIFAWAGWLAAAASLVFALFVLAQRTETTISVAEKLRRFEAAPLDDRGKVAWTAAGQWEGREISGYITWSDQAQEGYMVFDNLPLNDPSQMQYQLWIFDEIFVAEVEPPFPVDGGVFDSTPDGRVIVPIDPRLPIRHAVVFAITQERPGGVVVSDRSGLVLVAIMPPKEIAAAAATSPHMVAR